jgi:hypothetical protein
MTTVVMHRFFIALFAAAGALMAAPLSAQPAPPLFVTTNAPATLRADGDVVGMRLDRLFEQSTGRVLLNVGGHEWIARFDRLDTDLQGHRAWVGAIEGIDHSHVSFAERDGVVSGLINAISEVFEVRTIVPGAYALSRVDVAAQEGELEPLIDARADAMDAGATSLPQMAPDDRRSIDVLMLYTPGARTKLGGDAQIQALIAQIVSDTNTIFGRSGITTRVRLVGSQEFALTESTSMSTDLESVTNSAAARTLRDSFRADLVQLLEETAHECGIAWLLTSLSSTNFNGYSIADVDCVSSYTPTHEMGHNMGSHHAPEDNASFALFEYSFGYKDAARGFRTVMAYACTNADCPRIPNVSNPEITQSGGLTGASLQNNALSINNAAQTVANFRQAATATPPSAPTGLRSDVAGNNVTLSWNPVTSDDTPAPDAATSYTLQVGSASGLSNVFAQNVGNTTTVSGAVPSGTYFWRVIAANNGGQSPPSAESTFSAGACATPGAPQDFNFSLAGRVATLTWTPPAAGTEPFTYILEAGSSSGLANRFNGAVGGITTLTVQAPPGTYFVRVRAQNACGAGGASAERIIVIP